MNDAVDARAATALAEARRTLDEQRATLDGLRARTTGLLGLAAVVAGFALPPTGWARTTSAGVLLALAVLCVYTLWPRTFPTAIDARTLLDHADWTAFDTDTWHRELALALADGRDDNAKRLDRMTAAHTIALALTLAEIGVLLAATKWS